METTTPTYDQLFNAYERAAGEEAGARRVFARLPVPVQNQVHPLVEELSATKAAAWNRGPA